MRDFLESVPKAELHLHLRGAMPAGFFEQLLHKYPPREALAAAPQRHIEIFGRCAHLRPFLNAHGNAAELARQLFRYDSFAAFLASFLLSSYFFRDVADLRGLMHAVCAELASQNIVYAEITISVPEYVNQGIPLESILAALDETSASQGVRILWIVDLVRDIGPEAGLGLLRNILAHDPAHVVGITLGGSENLFPAAPFAAIYRLARDHGLRLTVHAGEAAGPESVWSAVRDLAVERIGHGVRAVEDERLVEHIAERGLPLEVCPTSNLRTGLYPSYAAHPIRELYRANVPLSVNTDDPTFFDTTLAEEYDHLGEIGLGEEDVLNLVMNGFRHAFLPDDEKRPYLAEVKRQWKAYRQSRSA